MPVPRAALALLLLVATSGSGAPPHPRMRGVCWEAGRAIDGTALDPLVALGVDWISETPFGWAPSKTAPHVVLSGGNAFFGLWGESDLGLAETARLARERGIKTLLKPHLWVGGGAWVGEIEMTSDADWQEWFASYESFIVHYAELAERERMDGLAIGTELPKTSAHAAEWRRIIGHVRRVYRGPLTYCANWHEAEDVAFWGDLDFIGVQAYYPLPVSSQPTTEEICLAWRPIKLRLAALAARTGKSVVFTEVGYRSLRESLSEPWAWSTDGAQDLELQKNAYRAMFESLWGESWFGGTFVWKWHPWLSTAGAAPLWHAFRMERVGRDFTPQGKPALEVIREWYKERP